MSEMLDRVAATLKESFKATVAESAGVPFEQTGVALPADAVWERYARAAVEALRGDLPSAVLEPFDDWYSVNLVFDGVIDRILAE